MDMNHTNVTYIIGPEPRLPDYTVQAETPGDFYSLLYVLVISVLLLCVSTIIGYKRRLININARKQSVDGGIMLRTTHE